MFRSVTSSAGLVLLEMRGQQGDGVQGQPQGGRQGSQVLCLDISLAGALGQSPEFTVRIVEISLSLSPWEIGLLGLI